MKILLINPPRNFEIIGNNPSIIEEERGYNPPLGILYIAAYLEENSNHQVSVIDAQVEQMNYEDLERRIKSENPDCVGITAMTMTLIDVIKTVQIVKRINDDIKIVLGGPHVHLYPTETIHLGDIDFLVLGEGEESFLKLVESIDGKNELRNIPGLVYKQGKRIINTGTRAPIENLDELPFPARHLVPYKKYSSLLTKGNIVTTIFTSRGCPFKCAFCDRPHLGKRFRARTPNNVVDELEQCTKMGIREFLFYDDTFTVNRKRVIDICREIVDRGLNISWDIRSRIDTIDEEMIKYLKLGGCQGIHYGIESGTSKVLEILKKGISLEQAKYIFDITRKYGIKILAYFMIGNPNETLEDILKTYEVMKELKPDYVHLTILTPFPGTEIYSNAIEKGIIEKDVWQEFAKHPSNDFVPPHWGEVFTREELNDLLIKGYKSFYIRPSYVFKRIMDVRSFKELKKKASAAFKVFKM